MQEPLLIARPDRKKFTTFAEYKKKKPEWRSEYPRGLFVPAVLCILGSFICYIIPWSPSFSFLHNEDSAQSIFDFCIIWMLFIILALLFSGRKQAVSHINLQSILVPLYVSGGIALCLTLFLGVQDWFFLHRFQAVPLAVSTILLFVVLWPFFSLFYHVTSANVDWLLRRFSKKEILKTALARQSLDTIKDINDLSS
jgi:hypothetical protein